MAVSALCQDPMEEIVSGKHNGLLYQWARFLYRRMPSHDRMTLDDAFSEETQYALEAAQRFDPSRGNKFITVLYRHLQLRSQSRVQYSWAHMRTPNGKWCYMDTDYQYYFRSDDIDEECQEKSSYAVEDETPVSEAERREALSAVTQQSLNTIQKILEAGYDTDHLRKIIRQAGRMWVARQNPNTRATPESFKVFVEERLGVSVEEFEALARDVDRVGLF